MQKKSARMRHRYFVRTQYDVITIKSLSYISTKNQIQTTSANEEQSSEKQLSVEKI
ncbi:hypothetical protein [Arsenophonus endosymbiont of Bemisia tabaci]|uniref:hypothetical protein n=1 Tax=Arsenophonus endosymbiont of Bemisia tabaci TaxID=536059 RepID=UPI0015F7143A|nr:hypothetical protein [Arsenophonus endosymbiont of Bemisia tabaci]CAA2930158.1 hypothetical protein ARSQ2_01280 [Arsenophonus endosymbiont of Bemisia tabaci Q2]